MPRTTAPATTGASIRCTTSRIRCPTRSRGSPTRSARWSSRITGRSTTGWWPHLFERDRPQQIEFARLNLNYTVMSKRKLLQLVQQKHVAGWDDPRMPTITGLRRRGYTPEAIRDFCARIGVAKKENVIDMAQLEHSVREDLNRRAPRVMAVLRPLKVVITNYPEGQVEELDVINNPEDRGGRHAQGAVLARAVHRARRLHGGSAEEVLPPVAGPRGAAAGAYFITCTEVVKDDRGEIVELRCTYDPGHARRRFAGRPAREGDDALGVGRARASASKCVSTIGCSPSRIPNGCRRERRSSTTSIPTRSRSCATAARSRGWPARPPAIVSSSSGSATSASIPIRGRARWSSTARSRSATPGRRIAAKAEK